MAKYNTWLNECVRNLYYLVSSRVLWAKQRGARRWGKKLGDRSVKTLRPADFLCVAGYLPFEMHKGKIRFKVYDIACCFPRYWWELRRFGLFFCTESNAMPKMITQQWRNFEGWLQEFGDAYLLLRAAYDVRGSIEQHYLRALEHPAISTVGLLLLLGSRALNARPSTCREPCLSLLNEFSG